jgi:hypothetical protein
MKTLEDNGTSGGLQSVVDVHCIFQLSLSPILTYALSVLFLLEHPSGIFWRIDYNSPRCCQLPFSEILWVPITSVAYLTPTLTTAPSSHDLHEHFSSVASGNVGLRLGVGQSRTWERKIRDVRDKAIVSQANHCSQKPHYSWHWNSFDVSGHVLLLCVLGGLSRLHVPSRQKVIINFDNNRVDRV